MYRVWRCCRRPRLPTEASLQLHTLPWMALPSSKKMMPSRQHGHSSCVHSSPPTRRLSRRYPHIQIGLESMSLLMESMQLQQPGRTQRHERRKQCAKMRYKAVAHLKRVAAPEVFSAGGSYCSPRAAPRSACHQGNAYLASPRTAFILPLRMILGVRPIMQWLHPLPVSRERSPTTSGDPGPACGLQARSAVEAAATSPDLQGHPAVVATRAALAEATGDSYSPSHCSITWSLGRWSPLLKAGKVLGEFTVLASAVVATTNFQYVPG